MAEPPASNAASTRPSALEIIATLLLALAAVATAWSSYQATRWNGEQAKAGGRTNAYRIAAARAQGLADDEKQADLATFVAWVDARTSGEAALADFYEHRFRPEFVPAFDAWLATNPFGNPSSPPSPFAMPAYKLAAADEATQFDQLAAASALTVERNIQRASNYVLGVVLFAVALFFAGLGPRLASPTLRAILIAVGAMIFVGTVVWLATFPVSLTV